MDDDDPPLTAVFKPPWKILRKAGEGHCRVVDADGRVLAYCYVKSYSEHFEHLTKDEAQLVAKAIARLSRPKI